MTKDMWCTGKVIVVLAIFSSGILYTDGEGILTNKNINGTDNILSLWGEGKCKKNWVLPLTLGDGKEHFCLKFCLNDANCEKDQKCGILLSFLQVCVRKCDVDDDCEYPTKCNKTEKYCFWEKCKSNEDCPKSLTCSLSSMLNEKFCSRRACYAGYDTECEDTQICPPKSSFCQCANGMSGRNCEVSEWCKENGKFKDCKGPNGTCEYNKTERTVNCICSNGKKLHPEENRCRETCDHNDDCKHGGICEEKGEYKFCSCKPGIIGDRCETVFDCSPGGKYKDCENSGGNCFYSDNKAICECPGYKRLNDAQFVCEACVCKGGECVVEEGKTHCKCPPGYGNFTNYSCRACDCGPDTSCIWEARFGGNKICLCKPGYSSKKGKCVACECGGDSNCEWISEGWFEPERKVCHCKPGYMEDNGKCVDCICRGGRCVTEEGKIRCNCPPGYGEFTNHSCIACECGPNSNCEWISEGGLKPVRKVCHCKSGYVEENGKCVACTCRGGECVIEDGNKVCKCPPGYGNITSNSCTACKCGADASCIWEAGFFGKKICLCQPGYGTKKGKCVACECGGDSNCEWIGDGLFREEKKVCHCKPGYILEFEKCVACDCGPDTSTETSCITEEKFPYTKICLCKQGYSTSRGKCVACKCGAGSSCEWIYGGWFRPDRKVCHCKTGYIEEKGKCVEKQDIGKS